MSNREHPVISYFKVCENIDWSMFALTEIARQQTEREAKNPMDYLVDLATGAKLARDKQTTKAVLYHLKRIIRYKGILNKEYGEAHDLEHTRTILKVVQNAYDLSGVDETTGEPKPTVKDLFLKISIDKKVKWIEKFKADKKLPNFDLKNKVLTNMFFDWLSERFWNEIDKTNHDE